jgi:hypothetical protein
MFFTCKQVSNHLSKEDYDKLPKFKKFTLVFHVMICPVCGAYNRQVMKFQDMTRLFRKKEDELLESDQPDAPKLDASSREKLKALLEQAEKETADKA